MIGIFGCATIMEPPVNQAPITGSTQSDNLRLSSIEQRLAALERILATGTLVELTQQVGQLQREVADLRGRSEVLEYNANDTTNRQRELYIDLDDRLRVLEQGNVRHNSVAVQNNQLLNDESAEIDDQDLELPLLITDARANIPGTRVPTYASDTEAYETAFGLLKQRRYVEAGAAFEDLMLMYPDSLLKDNATYWIGETFYVMGEFDLAIEKFQDVLDLYPDSQKIPDAMLKVGYSQYELKKWLESRSTLEELVEMYPGSTAGRLASQRLNQLSAAGY